jgi:hypothetical protein
MWQTAKQRTIHQLLLGNDLYTTTVFSVRPAQQRKGVFVLSMLAFYKREILLDRL